MELNETRSHGQGQGFKCTLCKGSRTEDGSFSLVHHCRHIVNLDESGDSIAKNGSEAKRSSQELLDKLEVVENELKDDYAKFEKMSKEAAICTLCGRGNESVNHCVECDQFLCSACVDNHTYMESTQNHALSTSGGSVTTDRNDGFQLCAEHNDMEVTTLCVTCEVELCTDCINPIHSGHELKKFPEVVQGLREMLQNGLEKFTTYREKSVEAYRELTSRATDLFGHETLDCIQVLKEELLKIMKNVLHRELELRKEILFKTTAKGKELNVKRALVKSLDFKVRQYLGVIPQLLKLSDSQLLQDRKSLMEQFAHLEQATTGFLNQDSFNDFVESGWSFKMPKESFQEVAESAKDLGRFMYTYGTPTQDKPTPTSSQHAGSLQRVLLDLQEEMDKNVLIRTTKCPATQVPSTKAVPNPVPVDESKEIKTTVVPQVANDQRGNDVSPTDESKEEKMDTSPVDLNGHENEKITEKNDPADALDTESGPEAEDDEAEEVDEKYKYSETPFEEEDGSSRDSDYDPILQTARNESHPRHTRRVSTDTLNSAGGGQASYDSDSDYSAVAVADKIKEWTKRSTPETNSEPGKADEGEKKLTEEVESKVPAQKLTKKQKVEESPKNGSAVAATARASRHFEISPNYQGRAQRNSRGRVPKKLEGFAFDLPRRSPAEKPKSATKNEEPSTRIRRRVHANEEQHDKKEEPSAKKPKAEPRVSKGRNSTTQATPSADNSASADLKTEIEQKQPKLKGKKSQVVEPIKPSVSTKPTRVTVAKPIPVAKPAKVPTPSKVTKPDKAPMPAKAVKATKLPKPAKAVKATKVPKPTKVTKPAMVTKPAKVPKPAAVEESAKAVPNATEAVATKSPKATTTAKATKATKATTATKNSRNLQVKSNAATVIEGEVRETPKIRIDQNNGVTNELDYPLTPTATDKMKITFDDSNEDYCTVCLDGGGVLICCDVCPKVFHGNCHLPAINGVPEDDWQCLFCTKKEELQSLSDKQSPRAKYIMFPKDKTISDLDFIYLCKFISELFKCKESLVVRGLFEKLLQMNNEEEPVHLNYIRTRVTLQTPEPFANIQEIVLIIRKMFGQAKEYYPEGTECGKRARTFENSFDDLLSSYYPGLGKTLQ